MATVLVLCFSDLARDPRVTRQIQWLADKHQVVAAGLAPPVRPDVRFIAMAPELGGRWAKVLRGLRLLLRRSEEVYWKTYGSAFAAIEHERPDLIISNDLDTLPLAIRLGDRIRVPVVYDAHEYAPREFDDSLRWRLTRAPYALELTRRYVPRTAAMMTVCQPIAEEFRKLLGVDPEIITNAPSYQPDLRPSPSAPEGIIRLIHHGGAIRARKLETMMEIVPHLDGRFELNFMLVDHDSSYLAELRRRAHGRPIRFLPPVPMPQLPAQLNQFDLGIYLLEPTNFNNRYALPNKFFEFLQGRLGIAIGPTPEMARIVRATGCGIVAEDFRPASLAKALNALTIEDIKRFKEAAHAAAEEYSAERNRDRFLRVIERVLS